MTLFRALPSAIPTGLRCWWALWLAFRACMAGDLALPATAELRTVDAPELIGLIEQELRREWKVQEGQLTVSFDRAAPEIRIPAGETTLRWVTRQPQPMRRLFPQFELVVQGRVVGRYACQVQVEWLKEVWVAEASMVAQSPIGSDTLKRQRMDVLSLQGLPWSGDPQSEECNVIAPIPAGAVILERQVRRRPLIQKGETVSARLQEGPLSVEFQAVALEDGYRGGGLRMRSLLKPVEMRGKVLNETTVVVVR